MEKLNVEDLRKENYNLLCVYVYVCGEKLRLGVSGFEAFSMGVGLRFRWRNIEVGAGGGEFHFPLSLLSLASRSEYE